jgi:hypothetical protein
VAEISYRNTKFYGISLYFDITDDIEINIRKTEQILNYLKGQGLLIAVDSNGRSKTLNDKIMNQRGRLLGDFLTIYNLHVVNDRSEPTFETARGSSYVDLTIIDNQLIRQVTNWACGLQESCLDHTIITFNLGMVRQDRPITNTDYMGIRCLVKKEDFGRFEAMLASNMVVKFNCENIKEGLEKTDLELCDKLNLWEDVDGLVDAAFSCITAACTTAFKVTRGVKRVLKKTAVCWWTEELTVLRKRTNVLRRGYQRTTHNENLRQERKAKYFDGRREYEGKVQEAKLKSWKTFCSISGGTNPWNIVYKIASGKIRTSTRLTTLEKENGTYTTDTRSTIMHILEHFVPDDREDNDNELHRKIRKEIQEPTDMANNRPFTKEEIIPNFEKIQLDKGSWKGWFK